MKALEVMRVFMETTVSKIALVFAFFVVAFGIARILQAIFGDKLFQEDRRQGKQVICTRCENEYYPDETPNKTTCPYCGFVRP
jgi:hypothetical protein